MPRSRSCEASIRSSSTCSTTARSRSSAPRTARACWPRWGEGDRIRATFNQTVARTGRLSSDAPNLHNIPVRTETGRAFRKAFVASDGFELLVADYNQIELRCIAHLAEDPGLIAAFEAGDDIHVATASRRVGRRAGRRVLRATVEGEDGVLRARLRHGGLRARPAAEHPHRRGPGDPRRVLRCLSCREGVHGAHRRRGSRARVHRDAVRPAAQDPRAQREQLPHPPGPASDRR